MSPKRLLVVIDEMEVGGSQRQIVHLLTGLDRAQWQPELAYFRKDSFLTARLGDAGIRVHHLPKRGRLDVRFLRAFSALLRRGDYDLIHAFSLTAELWAVAARTLSGRHPPLVASERNQQLGKPAWYWPIKRLVLSRSAGVIANSAAGARTTALHTRTPLAFFDTIANGVERPPAMSAEQRATMRAAIGVATDRAFGLFVGRLVPQKNLDCLIEAMALLDPGQRPMLALAGDGPLREHAGQLAAARGVASDLRFLGERSDAAALMQAADFLVLPSHFEGLSNALLEAMAAGCPVIASAVGGSPELIEHERTGLLFPDNDAAAFASCMSRLCADTRLRARLAHEARELVLCTYGIPALVAATVAVYQRCLGPEHGQRVAPPPKPTMPPAASMGRRLRGGPGGAASRALPTGQGARGDD